MNTRTLAALTLFASALAQASAQTYDLSPRFKAGDKVVYDLTFNIETPGQETIYKAKIRNQIIVVEEDGEYKTASYQTDHKLVVDGKEEISAAEEITEITTYDQYGIPIAIGGDNDTPESFRVANLTSFVAPRQPIAVGKAWTREIPADTKNGTRTVVHTYKLLRITKLKGRDVAEITLSVKETHIDHPASTTGKVWVDIKTGDTVKYEVSVKNMPIGDQYINGKVLIELE